MDSDPRGDDRVLMGWLLGAGFIIAGVLGWLSTVLAHYPLVEEGPVRVNSTAAIVLGAGIIALRHKLPPMAYRPLVLFGIAAVTLGLWDSGDPRTDTELFYVYPILFAFYFFRWWEAAVAWTLAVLLCTVVVADLDPDTPQAGVLIFAVVLAINGVAIGLLRDRGARLLNALEQSAQTDPLTGLLNRRGFQFAGVRGLDHAITDQVSYSLVILDLDDFKRVNDSLGHLGGDMTLERVSAVMGRVKRQNDVTARMGGEEFAILLPGAGGGQAKVIAERLRGAIQAELADSPAPITCSVGVASFPEHGATLEQLMRAADYALYAAKDAGKNRTVLYDEGLRYGAAIPDGPPPDWTPESAPSPEWQR
jgi:diguanylate cyclase (GGDEF)-like protein